MTHELQILSAIIPAAAAGRLAWGLYVWRAVRRTRTKA